MARKPTPKVARPPAKRGRPATIAAAKEPMAPPHLAPKMRGMSKMPRMMAKGGKVTGCK